MAFSVEVKARRRYATVVIDLDLDRRFTPAGQEAAFAVLRRYSRGVKGWSAHGSASYLYCARVPIEQAQRCAAELRASLEAWTEPDDHGPLANAGAYRWA